MLAWPSSLEDKRRRVMLAWPSSLEDKRRRLIFDVVKHVHRLSLTFLNFLEFTISSFVLCTFVSKLRPYMGCVC